MIEIHHTDTFKRIKLVVIFLGFELEGSAQIN